MRTCSTTLDQQGALQGRYALQRQVPEWDSETLSHQGGMTEQHHIDTCLGCEILTLPHHMEGLPQQMEFQLQFLGVPEEACQGGSTMGKDQSPSKPKGNEAQDSTSYIY